MKLLMKTSKTDYDEHGLPDEILVQESEEEKDDDSNSNSDSESSGEFK